MYFPSSYFPASYFPTSYFNKPSSGGALPTLPSPYNSDSVFRLVDCYPVADKGCSVIHDGQRTPFFQQGISINSIRIIWWSWEEYLDDDETISSIDWVIPASMTALGQAQNQTVTDSKNVSYPNSNALRFNAGATAGTYQLVNTITTLRGASAGRTLSRAINVDVRAYV